MLSATSVESKSKPQSFALVGMGSWSVVEIGNRDIPKISYEELLIHRLLNGLDQNQQIPS
jgi:hypothetical protein